MHACFLFSKVLRLSRCGSKPQNKGLVLSFSFADRDRWFRFANSTSPGRIATRLSRWWEQQSAAHLLLTERVRAVRAAVASLKTLVGCRSHSGEPEKPGILITSRGTSVVRRSFNAKSSTRTVLPPVLPYQPTAIGGRYPLQRVV